jgi:hypothetical protein
MHINSFRRWLRQVFATHDVELDCNELLGSLPPYVDLEVSGQQSDERFSDVRHHLDQCADCFDLYLTLRDAVRLEYQQMNSELAGFSRS